MNIAEYENNQYTRELNEVERYLMRMIQRYFDIEYTNSKESVEAIINESLARLKQDLLDNTNYIYNFNQEVGRVVLTIQKFNGEPLFDKNIAFNKDFGDIADTVCEGNDPRLYDDRIPLDHIHDMDSIFDLKYRIESLIIPPQDLHKNKNILDMIRYTGSMTEIDLAVLEHLQKSIMSHYESLESIQREIKVAHDRKDESITTTKERIQQELDRSHAVVQNSVLWLDNAKAYADRKEKDYKNYYVALLGNLVTDEQYAMIKNTLNRSMRFIGDGEFQLSDSNIELKQNPNGDTLSSVIDGESLKEIFDNGLIIDENNWEYDNKSDSLIYLTHKNSFPMILSNIKFKQYTHRITFSSTGYDSDSLCAVIAYDENSKNYLSLVVTPGGVTLNSEEKPTASIIYNYANRNYGDGHILNPIDSSLICTLSETLFSWPSLENKVTILIKRNINNIKVWIKYNEIHNWQENSSGNINPTESPIFDFNFESYSELNDFMNKKCRYGYGVFSQSKATFSDLFIKGKIGYDEDYGTTEINQKSEKIHTISVINNTIPITKYRIKLWFRHDGGQVQLPYSTLKDGHWILIQGMYDEKGKIQINMYISKTINGLADNSNINDNKIFIPVHRESVIYDKALQEILDSNGEFAEVSDKNFIQQLIHDKEFEYWINDGNDIKVIDKNGNIKTPIENEYGYIVKYDIKHLSDMFSNPRIYYQVYGERNE